MAEQKSGIGNLPGDSMADTPTTAIEDPTIPEAKREGNNESFGDFFKPKTGQANDDSLEQRALTITVLKDNRKKLKDIWVKNKNGSVSMEHAFKSSTVSFSITESKNENDNSDPSSRISLPANMNIKDIKKLIESAVNHFDTMKKGIFAPELKLEQSRSRSL